jgi:isochorismate synthase
MLEDTFFATIKEHFKDQLPFVVYSKPYTFDITALLQKNDTLYKLKDFSESGFVFTPFDVRKDSLLIPFGKSSIIKMSSEFLTTEKIESRTINVEQDKSHYLNLIDKVLERIRSNEFQKLVISRKEILKISTADIIHTLKIMLNTYNGAFVYCWFHPKVGLWLGATPETFIQVDGIQFKTMALAGTQEYKGTFEVRWKSKEIREQQMVTDYLIDVIKPYVDQVEVSEPKTIKAGHLLHLKTDITGVLPKSNKSLQKLILLLHPTPAVCGLPKMEALQFLIDNENYNREFYSGFLGELNKDVNLRCVQIKEKEAYVYVGGGITAASDPESEWNETVQKSKTIKSVIAL